MSVLWQFDRTPAREDTIVTKGWVSDAGQNDLFKSH